MSRGARRRADVSRRLIVALAVLAALTTAVAQPAGAVAGFGDVPDNAFFTEATQWMVDEGITNGIAPGCFAPEQTATRGQTAAFLFRMEGRPPGSPPHAFVDVLQDWQQDPVSWMSAEGITAGVTPERFAPEDPVTRAEVAVFLWRMEGEPAAPPSGFVDVVQGWQIAAVDWMANEGITLGTSPTEFSPDLAIDRAQLSTFLYRYKGSPPVVVDPASPACCNHLDTFARVDAALAQARLPATTTGWSFDVAGAPFVDRTNTGEEFGSRLGLDCGLRASSMTPAGAQLLVASWIGPRLTFVVQTTAQPSTPFRFDALFNLLYEEAYGEWIVDQTVWAARLRGGESIVIGSYDYGIGAVAKSWQSGIAPPGPVPVTIPVEQYAIDALETAGARNVGVAEFPEFGTQIGAIHFISPTGQISVATVAPKGWFDPMVPAGVTGPTTVHQVPHPTGTADVRVTEPGPGDLPGTTGEVGWACTDYDWRVDSGWGTANEIFGFAGDLLQTLGC